MTLHRLGCLGRDGRRRRRRSSSRRADRPVGPPSRGGEPSRRGSCSPSPVGVGRRGALRSRGASGVGSVVDATASPLSSPPPSPPSAPTTARRSRRRRRWPRCERAAGRYRRRAPTPRRAARARARGRPRRSSDAALGSGRRRCRARSRRRTDRRECRRTVRRPGAACDLPGSTAGTVPESGRRMPLVIAVCSRVRSVRRRPRRWARSLQNASALDWSEVCHRWPRPPRQPPLARLPGRQRPTCLVVS